MSVLPPLSKNTLISYADDSTLMESFRVLRRVLWLLRLLIGAWCLLMLGAIGVVFNPSKTFGLIISRSRTVIPAVTRKILFK